MHTYFDLAIERLDRGELEKHQLDSLRTVVARALKSPFYQKRLTGIGLTDPRDLTTLADAQKIPYTTKEDLRSGYPDGFLAADKSEVVRMHSSSGTTGMPTVIYHTQADLNVWTHMCARSIVATGTSRSDVFQNMMTYGLFTGGLGLHYGAEKVGCMVIPAGSGNTPRQIQLLHDFRTTVVHATPSYLLHLHDELQKMPGRPRLFLKKAFVGAEPHSEETRKKIEMLFGIDVYNSYGMSEMNGPGVAFECVAKKGMHLWEDAYLLEVIDPKTLAPLPDGQSGELVLTTLWRQATPLLRYRTRDLTHVLPGPCDCGRVHRRVARMKGRTDDMLIINGVNVFPSQIETLLMQAPEVGTNYQLHIEKQGALDKLIVKTEIDPKLFSGDIQTLERLKSRLRETIKSAALVNPLIELHEPGSLPVTQGKAVRVVDNRKGLY